MSVTNRGSAVPWWKEPTKDQWYAYTAAWLGWTLDAFDFTVFLLIMTPIAQEFGVPLIEVTAIFTVTLIMRLGGATASGWLSDRMGRRAPLMISILWYSICNLLAGFSPSFTFLFVVRALLGIGMGAEWPAGAALAMESWPARSRGFMSGVLQGSWGLGFALSAAAYGLLYSPLEAWHKGYGWRGMLILGVLPALACVWIRMYVKEPDVWAENKKIQNTTHRQVSLPLFAIFKRKYLFNTLTGCLWMAANFLRLLCDLGHAGHLSAEGAGLDTRPGSGPGVLGQHHHLPRQQLLGGGVGKGRAPLGLDDPHLHLDLYRAALDVEAQEPATEAVLAGTLRRLTWRRMWPAAAPLMSLLVIAFGIWFVAMPAKAPSPEVAIPRFSIVVLPFAN